MAAFGKQERIWFWGLLALAVVLRALNFSAFAMHHPDEVLQYLEPAYRLLTGEGIVTWEYRYGMRSWLLPWLLAGPMALGQAIGGDALTGIVAARFAGALIGLIPVIGAWHLGRRLSPIHGIVAMAAMAVWYEQIIFSTHLLTESLATALFIGAAALIDRNEGRARVMAGGALLAFAIVFRFHYAVAAAVFVLSALITDWKRWGWLIAGAVPVILLSSAVDLAMGQWPFQWGWTNVQLNLIEGRSEIFGTHPPGYFLAAIWRQWGWLTLPIAALAMVAGKPYRPILFAALFNLAVHSAVAHKEYRFIELTSASLVLLAAIGSVNAWQWLQSWRGRSLSAPTALIALLFAWAGASAWLGQGRPLDRWFGKSSHGPELVYLAGRDPRVCGLATMKAEFWQLSRVYLGRPIPIILLENTPRPLARLTPPGPELASINAIIAPATSGAVLPGYDEVRCRGAGRYSRCLYVRPGPCQPTVEARDLEIQRMLAEFDM
jgi:hypothetical protein